ncbi:signal transduction histidine kinase [Elusimicrobium simillimum]|uniref:histidine kinase dimerization/phospho-acceptor domain-containing protein n=1 Tax=Elusimicrobium simillimum TaxID=3143438 RepID=UPI003C6FAF36
MPEDAIDKAKILKQTVQAELSPSQQDGGQFAEDGELASLRKENKKLARQLSNMQSIFDRNKLIISAQSNLSAVIAANRTKHEKYLGMLLQYCPDIIMLLDQHGRFSYCTDEFLKVSTIQSFSQITARTYREVFETFADDDFISRIEAALKTASETNTSVSIDEVVDISGGNPRSYTIQIASMRDDKGQESGSLLIFHDLTDLIKAKQTAEQANNAKSDFLATVSHEIRTPMNAVIGIADMMKKTDLTKEQQGYLRNIQNSSQMLLNLINDILDFSKIEAGKLELIEEYFDLNKFLYHFQSVFQVMFAQKGLKLVCEFDASLPPPYWVMKKE